MIGAEVEGFAAGARDVAQWQQNFRRGKILAGSPEQPRAAAEGCDETFSERGLSGTGFRGDGHDPPAACAGGFERVV
jgi:hypothetical protein